MKHCKIGRPYVQYAAIYPHGEIFHVVFFQMLQKSYVMLAGKMGYNLYITENGDSLTSYTLYQSRDRLPNTTEIDVGIYPVALFETTQTDFTGLPVSRTRWYVMWLFLPVIRVYCYCVAVPRS